MAKGKQSSKPQQNHYSTYKAEQRHSANKNRRMIKHLKNHPNDEQTARVLKVEKFNYNRNKHGDNPGADKKELEANKKMTTGKRTVFDSKGFILKFDTSIRDNPVKSVRSQFNEMGVFRGRDLRKKFA